MLGIIKRAIKRAAQFIVVLLLPCTVAFAVDPFIVEDIRIEGLNRIAPGTVFNYLPLKIGDTFDDSRSSDAVRALFQTGFFNDIQLKRAGNVLVITVVERESIAEINLVGNKAIKTDDLLEGLAQIDFAVAEVFDESKLDKVKLELRRQYYAQGKYSMKLESKVTRLPGNRVAIELTVVEGDAARIRSINIVGNEDYGDDTLIKQFELGPRSLIGFFSKKDQYSRQKLSGDLETLRSFYLDTGYINFRVDSTQVSITPDKTEVYITINITEGEKFTIKEVKLAGELIVPQEDLFGAVFTRAGMVFSRKLVTESSTRITDRLGVDGYSFANVNAIPDVNEEERTVVLTYFIDPGSRVYVRRISFFGNAKTRDEVLRRELRQMEGSWISTVQVERSKTRLNRLGYFAEVNVETPAVSGTTDQVDVNYTVDERPSGNLMLGLGFSQNQGLIFNTSVAQDNFLGSGTRLEFAFNNSSINRQFVLGFTDPYWTIHGISRGFRVSFQETDSGDANITRFNSSSLSLGVNLGIPVSEFNFVSAGASYERTKLDTGFFVASTTRDFIEREGNKFDVLRLSAGFSYDTRNSAVFPTRGTLNRITTQIASPGGDLTYYKLDYDTRWFFPVTRSFTFLLKGRVGWGDAYGDTSELPFFENFFAGGPRSVRGYKENSLGPEDEFGRAIGGNLLVVGNAEVILPLPFLPQFNNSVRVTGFFDIGNVYTQREIVFDAAGNILRAADGSPVTRASSISTRDLRAATGLSAVWMSPFGVLSVSLAKPLRDQPGDETQAFQFTFGTSF